MEQSLAFGKWIEEEVKARDWSFRQLGRRANLSSGGISKVVNGHVQPTAKFCLGVATALKKPPEMVFRYAGLLPPLPDYEEIGEQSQQLLEYLRRYLALAQVDLDTAHRRASPVANWNL